MGAVAQSTTSGATCRVRVDANNLWTDPDDVVTHLHGLEHELTGIEEPLAPGDLDGLRRVAIETGVPVVLDESVCRRAQLADLAADPARWIVNVARLEDGRSDAVAGPRRERPVTTGLRRRRRRAGR